MKLYDAAFSGNAYKVRLFLALLGIEHELVPVDTRGDRSLTLRHTRYQRRPLNDSTDEMMRHVARLWGFTVRLEEVDHTGEMVDTKECPVVREVA